MWTVARPAVSSLLAIFLSAPSLCPAFFEMLEMCLDQRNLLSTATPRILSTLSTASFVFPKYRSGIAGVLFLDSIKVLHFVGSKVTFHLAAHTLIFSRSLFRLVKTLALSFTDLIGANSVESSAYRYSWFSQVSTRSSMKTENRRGPSLEPWGTEALMGEASDDWPERTTLMELP